jgi:hypothetical protein
MEDLILTPKDQKEILTIIAAIEKRLDNIEELSGFAIAACLRFKKGQRVQFSPLADRRRISQGRKGGVRKGTVVRTRNFTVTVLLDGYKQPRDYFHPFFEKVGRR